MVTIFFILMVIALVITLVAPDNFDLGFFMTGLLIILFLLGVFNSPRIS